MSREKDLPTTDDRDQRGDETAARRGTFARRRNAPNNGVMGPITRATSWLCDMDGVLIQDNEMVKGADDFLEKLRATNRSFLVLTNNSFFTPRVLRDRLGDLGLDVAEDQIWTSALATAQFVQDQRPDGTAFVIGESSMHEAIRDVGYHEDSHRADYVVLGETQDYSYDDVTIAVRLLEGGSHLVATNPEPTGPSLEGELPACGALAALLAYASGVKPYFVGKPNAVMLHEGLRRMGGRCESALMIGDRMETDVRAGLEAGIDTVLVLSGVAQRDQLDRYPYQPGLIIDSVADLLDAL